MQSASGARVLVVGLGDLGARVLELLAASDRIDVLVGSGSATPRSAAVVAQAALIADALDGPPHVRQVATDLTDAGSVGDLLRATEPDVVVFAASRHSWWRTPAPARSLPYGVWLPLQLSLMRTFMRAHRDTGSQAAVIALPHPDAAGPVLAAEGLAPTAGAGNVSEVAAKLRVLAAASTGCPRAQVQVHLVLHHAAERLAFSLFDPGTGGGSEPPYLAQVLCCDGPLQAAEVDKLLRRPYPLPAGTGSHQLTAATTARLVDALLDDDPQSLHVPAPAGLPGGYPVTVSRAGVELDLPTDVTLDSAVAVNEQAAAFDGIRGVAADGTLSFTDAAAAAAADVLGVTLLDTPLDGLDALAAELDLALRSLERPSDSG